MKSFSEKMLVRENIVMVKRKRLMQANQAEILRSHQRDSLFIRVLNDHFREILMDWKCRNINISTDTAMEILYFILTHGVGNQTLGEEYTGILPVNFKSLNIQPLSKMVLVTLTECFGQSFVLNLVNRLLKWMNSPRCKFTAEAKEYFNNYLQKFKIVLPILIIFHQGIFYITGRYPTVGKRLFRIDYAKVYGKRATQNVNWGINVLGLIIMVQCALQLWQIKSSLSKLNSDEPMEERIVIKNKDAMKCKLCLEQKSTTATVCGHLFCWYCITEWLQSKHHCPLCREPMSPSRIIHLMNL